MSRNLTPKQAIFIGQFLIHRNATRAAVAAGVPLKSAHVTASRWLKNPTIAAAIEERNARIEEKLDVTAERVLRELAKLAFYDPLDLFDAEGNPKPVTELDEIARAAIAGIEVETRAHPGGIIQSVTRKVKLADKGQNLERLGRYLKLFTDNVNHSGRLTLEDLVRSDGGSESGAAEAA